jgi:dinuclear metal center YbgI/SA1388 family protein
MSLKVENVKNILEEYAPLELKQSYDNVGLMIGNVNSEITGILIALDCTLEVIREAEKKGCNLIITHHPPLYIKPSTITSSTLTGVKIMELIKNGISVYSSHTNLDATKGGLNDILGSLLGFTNLEIIELISNKDNVYEGAGIGRITTLEEPITLKYLCENIKKALGATHIRYCGDDVMEIDKIAIINGSGEDYFEVAKELGVQCIITGDTTYHQISDFNEMGIAIIDAGHFETEWPAMKVVAKFLEKKIRVEGFNNSVIISECSKSPYKYT